MPQVSVVVPIYNTEKYLSTCIDSIINQTFTNIELILVNDGSIDNSGKICDEYALKDSRIRVYHRENGGVTSARRAGVENAIGEYISFVDSDDILPNDSIEILYNSVEDNDIIIGKFIELKENKISKKIHNKKNNYITLNHDQYLRKLIEIGVAISPCARLYKRTLFDDRTFDISTDITNFEDLIMNINIAINSHFVKIIENNVYLYRQHKKSSSHSFTTSLDYVKKLHEIIFETLMKNQLADNYKESLIHNHIKMIERCLLHGSYNKNHTFIQNVFEKSQIINLSFKERILLLIFKYPFFGKHFLVLLTKMRKALIK